MDKNLLSKEELRNLSRLLISDDNNNIELGLTLLESQPSNSLHFIKELQLIASLHNNINFKNKAKRLLIQQLSKEKMQLLTEALSIVNDYRNYYDDSEKLQEKIHTFEQARPSLQVYLEQNTQYAYKLYKLGRYLHLTIEHYYPQAAAYYRTYLQCQPMHEDALYCLAYLLANEKETAQEAIGLYQKVLEINPKSPGAHNNIGHIYDRHQSNFKKALGYYEKAHQLAPQETRYHRNLSHALYYLGGDENDQRAKALLQDALEIAPEQALNWKHWGDFLWNVDQDLQAAKKAYLQGLQHEPNNEIILSNLAELYIRLEMYDIAYVIYQKGFKEKATPYSLAIVVSILVLHLDKLEEAKQYYLQLKEKLDNVLTRPKTLKQSKWNKFLDAQRILFKHYPQLNPSHG